MKPVLHQLKTDGRPLDGMSYVLECGDGKLIVIDGGMMNDVEYLYNYLKQLSCGAKPCIAAWFITHVHADHTFAFIGMGEQHGEDLCVEKLICRYPAEEFILKTEPVIINELKRMDAAAENFKGLERVIPNSGDRYTFGELDIEILYTCADLPCDVPAVINDTSTVFRVNYGGQSILFLGDAEPAADRVMIDRYGKALKSDVVQLAHHGCNGSTSEFYSLVDAQYVLWPVNAEYPALGMYQFAPNRTIYASGRVKDTFIAGYGTRRKELPLEADYAPYVMGGVEIHREVKAQKQMTKAEVLPDVTNPADPAWDQAPEMDACGDYVGKRNGAYGRYRILWSESAIYLKASFYKNAPISDADSHLVDRCNNIRIHLVEDFVNDMSTIWDKVSGDEYLRGVILYPEEKNLPQGKGFNTRPDRCESYGFMKEDGYDICAKISLAKTYKAGDLIGFHVELSALEEKGGRRTLRMTLADQGESLFYRFTPAGILYWELK